MCSLRMNVFKLISSDLDKANLLFYVMEYYNSNAAQKTKPSLPEHKISVSTPHQPASKNSVQDKKHLQFIQSEIKNIM